MKPSIVQARDSGDRVSTADEIRAAMLPSCAPIDERAVEVLCEIASDLGGYLRIPAVEIETSLMVEELIQDEDPRVN